MKKRFSPPDEASASMRTYVRKDPIYDDNPLIRHIDPILQDTARVEAEISYMPPFPGPDERAKPAQYRLKKTGMFHRLHIPLNRDFEVAFMIDELICEGYVDRAPNARYWERHNLELASFLDAFRSNRRPEHADRSVGLTGLSGIGKSRTLSKILSLLKPVIAHDSPGNPNLPLKQVVCIKVECPHDRRPGSIAKKIISEIGRVIGEDYAKFYGGANDDLILNAGSLCRQHFVGLIVVDDVQNAVSRAKKPRTDIVDLLVELSNELGVPMLFVGTTKAVELLGREMRSGRKILGPTWDRFSAKDADWKALLSKLWRYQWNATFTPLNSKLEDKVYELTQGVPAFLIRLFHFAQRRAILNGRGEKLTAELLQESFDISFTPVKPIVRALASGDQALLGRYEDLPREFALEEMLARECEELRISESNLLRRDIRNARLRATHETRKRLALQAALAVPSSQDAGPSPTHVVVDRALKANRDPIQALASAGLIGRELLFNRDVLKSKKAACG